MGKIVLSCGHEDLRRKFGIPLVIRGYDVDENGPYKITNHSVVCTDCYHKYVDDCLDDMLFTKEEEEEWFERD